MSNIYVFPQTPQSVSPSDNNRFPSAAPMKNATFRTLKKHPLFVLFFLAFAIWANLQAVGAPNGTAPAAQSAAQARQQAQDAWAECAKKYEPANIDALAVFFLGRDLADRADAGKFIQTIDLKSLRNSNEKVLYSEECEDVRTLLKYSDGIGSSKKWRSIAHIYALKLRGNVYLCKRVEFLDGSLGASVDFLEVEVVKEKSYDNYKFQKREIFKRIAVLDIPDVSKLEVFKK
jgi:hypothetical protein